MSDEGVDELGPVDYLVVEFPATRANFSGEIAEQLSALAKSGTIRVLDLLFLKKNLDGSVEGFESHEFEDSEVGQLRELEAELAMLLADQLKQRAQSDGGGLGQAGGRSAGDPSARVRSDA